MVERAILDEIRPRLEQAFPKRLDQVLIFGSEARKEATAESDIDLLVVLDGPLEAGRDLRTIVDALYPLQLQIDRPIHALPAAAEKFHAGESALYRQVKQEGVAL